MISLLATVAAVALASPPAGAPPLRDYVERVARALAEASAARVPTPPVPVPVMWRARLRGTIELGRPLLALEVVDLDGDGKDELLALTDTELAALSTAGDLQILARAPLPARPATVRARDPVGALLVTRDASGLAIVARSSEQAVGGRYRWRAGALVNDGEVAGYRLCDELTGELTPGRNHFDPASLKWSVDGEAAPPLAIAEPFYAARCRAHIGVDGRGLRTIAVSDLEREVRVACRGAAGPCPAAVLGPVTIDAAGHAFEIADVDRDGRPEVIVSRGQPRGEKDRVRVFAAAGAEHKLTWSHAFEGGVVAIAAPDIDGDGALEVVAAVRPIGSKRINLWTLCATR